jgi:hypothetical protein
MNIQKGIFCGIVVLLLAGLTTFRPGALTEVGDDEANGLVGGQSSSNCKFYSLEECGDGTGGCQLTACYIADEGGDTEASSYKSTQWCGCSSRCTGTTQYQGLNGCGSS